MLTPEQLKGKIRNVAKEKNLSSQEILQMYLFERVLERLSQSKYRLFEMKRQEDLITSDIFSGRRRLPVLRVR